ncbi:hypothetical protein ACFL09_07020 [Planctomycetota bacterium]
MTILMCSHLLADVQDVCDRIGVLYAGKLWVVGGVHELLAQRQFTQLTVPALSPEVHERAIAALAEVVGADVEVGHPRDRLDAFFLRVIEEARQAQPDTAGAGIGRFDDTLFKDEPKPAEGREVLDQLTAAPAEAQPEEAAPAPEPEPTVLDDLTAKPERPAQAEPAEVQERADADQAERRTVLDRLVGGDDAKPEGE